MLEIRFISFSKYLICDSSRFFNRINSYKDKLENIRNPQTYNLIYCLSHSALNYPLRLFKAAFRKEILVLTR